MGRLELMNKNQQSLSNKSDTLKDWEKIHVRPYQTLEYQVGKNLIKENKSKYQPNKWNLKKKFLKFLMRVL